MAEVLITLTIVGVIAALTIPNLMSKYQEHSWHQKWKEDYALINNAYKMVVSENPDIIIRENNSYGFSKTFMDEFLAHLKIVESCGNRNDYKGGDYDKNKCDNYGLNGKYRYNWAAFAYAYSSSIYKTLKGGKISSSDFRDRAALLPNGSSINFGGIWNGLTILVDVNNASQGPNILGKDTYVINIVYPNGNGVSYYKTAYANELVIQPQGAPNRATSQYGPNSCTEDTREKDDRATISGASGSGCSYKYLYEK